MLSSMQIFSQHKHLQSTIMTYPSSSPFSWTYLEFSVHLKVFARVTPDAKEIVIVY